MNTTPKLNSCNKHKPREFIRIIDTQTEKAGFTPDGKIAVLKQQLLGAARDHWSKYTGGKFLIILQCFINIYNI